MFDDVIEIPPFTIRVRSSFEAVSRHVGFFYRDCRRPGPDAFLDFDIEVRPGAGPRRWWRPQARFELDGAEPFFPLPANQAAPLLEWGLNFCVAHRPLGYLVMHAAVLARNGQALMLPGFPGAGKSTLCASLALCDGWRLLSDELAILDPADVQLIPHPRPISVKNRSIDIVADFPGAGKEPGRIVVEGPDGRPVPAQVLGGGAGGSRVAFVAAAPSVGFAVYTIRHDPSKPDPNETALRVTDDGRRLESDRYIVKIDDRGDVASIYDRSLDKELLSAPARIGLFYENPSQWPAWNGSGSGSS